MQRWPWRILLSFTFLSEIYYLPPRLVFYGLMTSNRSHHQGQLQLHPLCLCSGKYNLVELPLGSLWVRIPELGAVCVSDYIWEITKTRLFKLLKQFSQLLLLFVSCEDLALNLWNLGPTDGTKQQHQLLHTKRLHLAVLYKRTDGNVFHSIRWWYSCSVLVSYDLVCMLIIKEHKQGAREGECGRMFISELN